MSLQDTWISLLQGSYLFSLILVSCLSLMLCNELKTYHRSAQWNQVSFVLLYFFDIQIPEYLMVRDIYGFTHLYIACQLGILWFFLQQFVTKLILNTATFTSIILIVELYYCHCQLDLNQICGPVGRYVDITWWTDQMNEMTL